MTVARLNYVLAALVFLVVGLALILNTDRTRPHYEFMPDMKYSPAYDAFSDNPNFSDGRTMRVPVVGTVAHDEKPLDFSATLEDAELEQSRARGAEMFRVYCAVCHGASGDGDGPVAKRGFPPPPKLTTPDSLKTKEGLRMTDSQLFEILTVGRGSMPQFAAQLTPQQRLSTIHFVRTLQPQEDPADAKEADDEDADKQGTGAAGENNADGTPPEANSSEGESP